MGISLCLMASPLSCGLVVRHRRRLTACCQAACCQSWLDLWARGPPRPKATQEVLSANTLIGGCANAQRGVRPVAVVVLGQRDHGRRRTPPQHPSGLSGAIDCGEEVMEGPVGACGVAGGVEVREQA